MAIATNVELVADLKGPIGPIGPMGTVERGTMPNGTYVTGWTNKGPNGAWDIPNIATAKTIVGLPAEAAEMPGRFIHSAAADGIPFQFFITYGNYGTNQQKGVYFRTIKWFGQVYDDWVNLIPPKNVVGTSSSPEHLMRESELRRRRQVKNTHGKGVVSLVFDHGTNNFKDLVLPALVARGLVATLALNSQMYDPAQWRYPHDDQTNWTMIQGWATSNGIEIANHGRTHKNFSEPAELETEIRGGREELEAQLGFPIDSWVQTGVPIPGYGGFDNGKSAEVYWSTPAGQIILASHAVATGSLPAPKIYPMDGTITQGVQGFWIDAGAAAVTEAKTQIQAATASGKGVLIRCHPEVLNVDTNTTTAELHAFLDWVKAEVDAGNIHVLQLRDWAIANDYGAGR